VVLGWGDLHYGILAEPDHGYLLVQSWQVAVLILIVAATAFFLRNRSAHVRYLLWLLVLAKCLAPPVTGCPCRSCGRQGPGLRPRPGPVPGGTSRRRDLSRRGAGPARSRREGTAPASATPEGPAPWSLRAWLGLGWLVGAAGLLLHYLLKALRMQLWLHRVAGRSQGNGTGAWWTWPPPAASTPARHLAGPGIGQPFVWGLLRGSIHLPAEFVRETDSQHTASLLAMSSATSSAAMRS